MGFSEEQLENWRDYERVRQGGRFNMLDPRARYAAGLSEEEYEFVLSNYSELRAANNSKEKT